MIFRQSLIAFTAYFMAIVGMQAPAYSDTTVKHDCSGGCKEERPAKVKPLVTQFKHNIQLQLADFLGVLVENTEFWVTVDVVKIGDQVTLHLPAINFQVGQCSGSDPFCSEPSPGYVYTAQGFLPKDFRPAGLVPVSVNAASNDGYTLPGLLEEPLPVPPTGYIVQVTNSGALQIQGTGSFGNVLPLGPQNVLPCTITYLAEKETKLCKNFVVSEGVTNLSQFIGDSPFGTPAGDNIRDSHINDAFDNTLVWAWTDNHNVDKSANILNVFVAVGKYDKNGKLKVSKPVQITNFGPNTLGWDTAVAINRSNKNNIVVTYAQNQYDSNGNLIPTASPNCRAVSFDGGKTFGGVFDGVTSLPYNGLMNYQPVGGQGSADFPGVKADSFGNFWVTATNAVDGIGNPSNVPFLLNSQDGGVTWDLAYQFPAPPVPATEFYDYPHSTFGQYAGQYGIWTYADYFPSADCYPTVSFLPVTGLGSWGTGVITYLDALVNTVAIPTIAASMDGRFWTFGPPNFAGDVWTLISPTGILYKSPGDISDNYSGPFISGTCNFLGMAGLFTYDSVPFKGYFQSVEGLIYDDNRQALYALFSTNYPDLSQNMRLYFMISRNNGLTWTRAYQIATTDFANRGFSSMALDPVSGNISIGWYDGRKDKQNLQNLQYFGAVIPSKKLNKLIKKIPASDPLFLIPGQGTTVTPG